MQVGGGVGDLSVEVIVKEEQVTDLKRRKRQEGVRSGKDPKFGVSDERTTDQFGDGDQSWHKKLLGTSASLLVTSALLVVTRSY